MKIHTYYVVEVLDSKAGALIAVSPGPLQDLLKLARAAVENDLSEAIIIVRDSEVIWASGFVDNSSMVGRRLQLPANPTSQNVVLKWDKP